MRFYLLPVKNVQLVFHRSPTFTHDQFKTTCGTYLQSPLPSVSPRILGTCTIISRIKIAICRYTVLLSPSYWNVCNRRPLLRSFERYACIFTRTGCVSLHFTLFPQRYSFFSSQQSFSFSFFFFLFFSTSFIIPLLAIVWYCLIELES